MANQNGQLVLQALLNFDGPATLTEIVTHIADIAEEHPSVVKEFVEETLKGGIRYGFIQHRNRKYSVAPIEQDAISMSDDTSDSDDEVRDRPRRRRRGRGRGRSRRRRSRRRRSRR